jgi:prepilin-type N-terminal cleavage/methylation domain-containing protein
MATLQSTRAQILEHKHSGFTLVELLVSTVIISIILGGLIIFPQIIGRGSQQSQRQNTGQSAIDSDLARLRTLANNFSCCSGTCTTSLSPSPCNSKTPGQEDFYIPTAGSTAETTFNTACNAGTLASTLQTSLNSQSPAPAIISRAISVNSGDAVAHRLRVSYSAPGNVERVAILVPTAAAFCPDK